VTDSIDRAQKSIDAAISGLADIRDAVDGARVCTGPKLAERQRCISILVEMAREESRELRDNNRGVKNGQLNWAVGADVERQCEAARRALMQAARRIKGGE
jgi:hypothetical protein